MKEKIYSESEISSSQSDQELAQAAEKLVWDYENDKALTAFTALDAEPFDVDPLDAE